MAKVTIKKEQESQETLPIIREMARKMDEVRERAFQLFENRGGALGGELDDWVTAEREILGWPKAELKEQNGGYEVEVSLPGFAPKDVEVNATPNELIVHAATAKRAEGTDDSVVRSELGGTDIYRRFAFPEGIDTEKIVAELDNGLLRVKAPKSMPLPSAERSTLISAR